MAEIDDIEAIYREYGNDILRMSYLYLKDKHLAEDALQETFVRVIRFYSKFNHKSSIKTWVTQIAINVCKVMLRSRTSEVLDYEDRAVDIADEHGNAGFDDVENSSMLTPVIQNMEEEMRTCVILFYYQDLSTREIEKITGIKRSTVEFRLKEARKLLRGSLKGVV